MKTKILIATAILVALGVIVYITAPQLQRGSLTTSTRGRSFRRLETPSTSAPTPAHPATPAPLAQQPPTNVPTLIIPRFGNKTPESRTTTSPGQILRRVSAPSAPTPAPAPQPPENVTPLIPSPRKIKMRSVSEHVELLDSWGGPTLTVATWDHYIFSGSGGGFYVLDVSNASSPIVLGRFSTEGKVSGLLAHAGYLYVGTGSEGLFIYDIANPANPTLVGWLDTPGFARSMYAENALLYLADSSGGLRIIDIHDPYAPVELGFFIRTGSSLYSVRVHNSVAYATETNYEPKKGNIVAIDVSNPAKPFLLSSVDLGWGNVTYGLDMVGSTVYAAAGPTGMAIVDASNPSDLKRASLIGLGNAVLDVNVKNNLAYTSMGGGLGLKIVDVSDSKKPTLKGGIATADNANVVRLIGNHAFIANDDAGLRIMDVTNPGAPKEVHNFLASSVVYNVFVQDDKIYSIDTDVGILVAERNNGKYEVVGKYKRPYPRPQPLSARGLYVKNNYIYMADGDAGLRILDASNLANIYEVGFFDPENAAFSAVDIVGNLAFVSDMASQGLRIINIANPAKPVEIGHWFHQKGKEISSSCKGKFVDGSDRPASSIKVKNNIAYLSADRVILVDVSDPKKPKEITRIDPGGNARGLALLDATRIVVASNTEGIKMLDIANPCNPLPLGAYKIQGSLDRASDVTVEGDIAYIAYGGAGMLVVDISDPNNPEKVGFYDTPNSAMHVFLDKGIIFLADADTGVLSLQYTPDGL